MSLLRQTFTSRCRCTGRRARAPPPGGAVLPGVEAAAGGAVDRHEVLSALGVAAGVDQACVSRLTGRGASTSLRQAAPTTS